MAEGKIFISYAHEDEDWKKRLTTYLDPVARAWDDTHIGGGQPYEEKIRQAIDESQAAVLLVSADFLASDFIKHTEVPYLMKRRKPMIPLIVSACAWKYVPWLAKMKVMPKDGRPLAGGSAAQIAQDLTELADEADQVIKSAPAPQPPVPTVEMAFADLDRRFAALRAMRSANEVALGVIVLIEVAISYGAPIYNDGSWTGCATIYAHAREHMLEVLTHVAGDPGQAKPILDTARTQLNAVIIPINYLESPNLANRLAWDLRHAFDAILESTKKAPKSWFDRIVGGS